MFGINDRNELMATIIDERETERNTSPMPRLPWRGWNI